VNEHNHPHVLLLQSGGGAGQPAATFKLPGGRLRAGEGDVAGRGLHSSTFRLNVSAFCGIGGYIYGLFRRGPGGVRESRGCRGCILCQKRLKLS
jgi:hypothetical protein